MIGRANLIGDVSFPRGGPPHLGTEVLPGFPLGTDPDARRAFIRGARLAPTLAELERELVGVAIQGTVARMGEVALLAFDPAKGSAGFVDLSASSDIELVRLDGRSWMPERR